MWEKGGGTPSAPLCSLSRHMDPAHCLGAAPGHSGLVKLRGAASEGLVTDSEGKYAGFPILRNTARVARLAFP